MSGSLDDLVTNGRLLIQAINRLTVAIDTAFADQDDPTPTPVPSSTRHVYLDHIQVLPDGSGATTLQPLALGAWVPQTATRMYFSIRYYRAEADVFGNMDSVVSIRRPSDLTHDIYSIGIAGAGQNAGSQMETIGISFDMPNDPVELTTIYWIMQGSYLTNTSWSLYLIGYDLP